MAYKAHAKQVVDLEFDALLGETGDAWHVLFDEAMGTANWIPKSRSEMDKDSKVITVEAWLVEKEGLEDYAV